MGFAEKVQNETAYHYYVEPEIEPEVEDVKPEEDESNSRSDSLSLFIIVACLSVLF